MAEPGAGGGAWVRRGGNRHGDARSRRLGACGAVASAERLHLPRDVCEGELEAGSRLRGGGGEVVFRLRLEDLHHGNSWRLLFRHPVVHHRACLISIKQLLIVQGNA